MTQTNNVAKFAFFYLLSLVALLFMALSSGMIVFQIINKYVTDILNQYSGEFSSDTLKFAISALVISAPIYFVTMKQIHKNLFSGSLDKDAGVRKWLTYFVILVSTVVMIGWLIGTLNSFLNGDLTLKFILKAITAIGISATIFTFYLHDIKREEVAGKSDAVIKYYFYGALIFVLASFIASLFVVESPTETRNRKIDTAVLNSFDLIDSQLNRYWQENQKMPASLDELVEAYKMAETSVSNPQDQKRFDYKLVGDRKYELCTNFKTSNLTGDINKDYYRDRWPHDAGYQCMSQKIINPNDLNSVGNIPTEKMIR